MGPTRKPELPTVKNAPPAWMGVGWWPKKRVPVWKVKRAGPAKSLSAQAKERRVEVKRPVRMRAEVFMGRWSQGG